MIIEPAKMSGEKTASTAIYARPCLLAAVDILPPSTGSATLKIYDNASAASGTIIFEASVVAGTAATSVNMSMARYAQYGLYASWTNTSGDSAFNVGFIAG